MLPPYVRGHVWHSFTVYYSILCIYSIICSETLLRCYTLQYYTVNSRAVDRCGFRYTKYWVFSQMWRTYTSHHNNAEKSLASAEAAAHVRLNNFTIQYHPYSTTSKHFIAAVFGRVHFQHILPLVCQWLCSMTNQCIELLRMYCNVAAIHHIISFSSYFTDQPESSVASLAARPKFLSWC